MSKYYHDSNVGDEENFGLVNLLNDDNYLDDNHSPLTLLDNTNNPATFCVRCRSLSNTAINDEWDSSFDHTCNGHIGLHRSNFQPGAHTHLLKNGRDSTADTTPLLSHNDVCNNITTNPLLQEDSDHCHTTLPLDHNSSAVRQLVAAMSMCLVFMVAEVVGGYLAGSLAVMTDAAHLTSDFAGFLVSLFAIRLGKRPPNKRMTFGYLRAEVLGALLSIALIWMLTGIFICLAVQRIINRDFRIAADTMMVVAAIGIVINIVMGLVLHGVCSGISHTHGHSHSATNERWHELPSTNHNQKNINIRAAVIHVIGDLIQSVGVFVSAIIIKYYPSADLIDPVCTLVFSLLALTTTGPVLRDSVRILMESFPRSLDYSAVASSLRSVDGVRAVHDLHVWCLTVNTNALAVHLAVDGAADPEAVLCRARQVVRRKFGILNATIQVERYSADAMSICAQCQPLGD